VRLRRADVSRDDAGAKAVASSGDADHGRCAGRVAGAHCTHDPRDAAGARAFPHRDIMLPTPTKHDQMKEHPDHRDAEIVLRVYELRREPVMRESRHAINSKFWPKSWEEVQAVMKMDHPLNAAFRQTTTYWEMVYGMARYGVVHADFLLESNGEGLLLFARMKPFLQQYRDATSPHSLRNAEWVATHSEVGRQRMQVFDARVARAMETRPDGA
jgi:hypothetical protein